MRRVGRLRGAQLIERVIQDVGSFGSMRVKSSSLPGKSLVRGARREWR
jgi:hypothetical protein